MELKKSLKESASISGEPEELIFFLGRNCFRIFQVLSGLPWLEWISFRTKLSWHFLYNKLLDYVEVCIDTCLKWP